MRKILTAALIIFAAFVVCSAQTGSNALLYKISGKGVTRPSYIFGTFHVVCPNDMLPMDKITSYVASSDQTIMEIDMDDQAELQAMLGTTTLPDGKSLSDYLTPKQYQKVDEFIRSMLGYSVDTVKTKKPSVLSVMALTSPKGIGCATPSSYDVQIMLGSITRKKPIVGLETVAFQSQTLDTKPVDKQAKDLYETAANPQKSIDELKKMTSIYKTQDVEALARFSERQMKKDPQFEQKLVVDRNASWIPKIEAQIGERSSFIAVGAAHLGGKKGVLELLRQKGYTLTPIRL